MAIVPQYSATPAGDGSTPRALYFALTTSPETVHVSPSVTDPELADFIFVGTRRGYPIHCDKITLTVRTGTGSHQLALDLEGIDPLNSLDWTPEVRGQTITFTPATEDYAEIVPDKGVTIQLMKVRINAEIGSSALDVEVRFRDADSTDPNAWDTDKTTFDIGKFPADFYVRNFIPDKLSIDSGEGVSLSWEVGGATSLRLLYEAAEINVLNYVKWPPRDEKIELRNTTVFYLRAGIQAGTSFIERILSATVTVIRPELELGSLIVYGDTVLKGDILVTPGNTLMADTLAAATTHQMVLGMSATVGSRVNGGRYGGYVNQSFDTSGWPDTGATLMVIRRFYEPKLYLTVDASGQLTARNGTVGLNQLFSVSVNEDGSRWIFNLWGLRFRALSMTADGVLTLEERDEESIDQKFNIVTQGDGSKGIREWRTRFAHQIMTPGLNVNGKVAATAFDVRSAATET